MYIFIHKSEPNEVIRLSEAISLSAFGERTVYTDVLCNEAGDLVVLLPSAANGDAKAWSARIHESFERAQAGLRNGQIEAIAQSPNDGQWVKIPTEYWIAHPTHSETLNLDQAHEFAGAAIVVDRDSLPNWFSIFDGLPSPGSSDRSEAAGPRPISDSQLTDWFKARVKSFEGKTPPKWRECWEKAKSDFPQHSITRDKLQKIRREVATNWKSGRR